MQVYSDIIVTLLKNEKTQRAIILILSGLIAFGLGYASKHCDGPDVLCLPDKATIRGLQAEVSRKDTQRVEELQKQRDASRVSCDKRVEKAKEKQRASNDFLQCSDICHLYPQCKEKGRCK